MSLRSEAETEAEKRYPTPPHCSDEERGIAYLQRTEFVAGAQWLADRLLSDEAVERVARELYKRFTTTAFTEWDDIDDDSDVPRSAYMAAARAALRAALGDES